MCIRDSLAADPGQPDQLVDGLRDLAAVVLEHVGGRKTANVVLGTFFSRNEGVVVDTHVGRLSRRLGLTSNHDPVKVERDLMALLPMEEWTIFSHRLIWFGREVCTAKDPRCDRCELADVCPSAFRVGRFVKAAPAKTSRAGR